MIKIKIENEEGSIQLSTQQLSQALLEGLVYDLDGQKTTDMPDILVEILGLPTFYVDIPPTNGRSEWNNVKQFYSKPDALKYAKEHFGADDQGRISIISES